VRRGGTPVVRPGCWLPAGIAATSALKLVKAHGSLAAVIASLDKTKHPVPTCDYDEVRS